jgi:hypothetical protein
MMTSVQTKPMPATLATSEVRLALVSWKSELISLANKFPEHFPSDDIDARLLALEAALLAIDTSKVVSLIPVA